MQTSRRRGPSGRNRARASAGQVGTEGGERGRSPGSPWGGNRRSNESTLVRSPDEADASTGKGLQQRERDKNQGVSENWYSRKSLRSQGKNTRTSTSAVGELFATVALIS